MNRSRLTLLGIIAVFALPLLAAIYLNSRWSDWQPPTTSNRGQLLAPVVPLSEATNRRLAAANQWVLLQVRSADCAAPCQSELTALENVRRALGRKQDLVAVRSFSREQLGLMPAMASGTYLRDPAGNLMMVYSRDNSLSDIRKDLDRLLKNADNGS